MNGARERRLFMATSMVKLRVGVAAADGAHKPLSRQQRYARSLKIAACAAGPCRTPRPGRERPEGASGNLFRAQFPERRGGSPWASRTFGTPNTPALPAWWMSAAFATRQTIKGDRPALATQLRALPWEKTSSRSITARAGRCRFTGRSHFGPEVVPACLPGCAGGCPRPTGGRVAIFPTSAFMEMKACVPAEYSRGRRPRRSRGRRPRRSRADDLDAGRRYRAVVVWAENTLMMRGATSTARWFPCVSTLGARMTSRQ